MTKELEVRFDRHNKGGSKSTKSYAPFEIIYSKKFKDYKDARVHEKFLKTGAGRRYLKEWLSG